MECKEPHVNQEEYLKILQRVSRLNETDQVKKYFIECEELYNSILKQISILDYSDLDQLLNLAVRSESLGVGYSEDDASGDGDSQIAGYYCTIYRALHSKFYDYVRNTRKNVLEEYQIWAKHIDTIPNYRAANDTINKAMEIYLDELKKLTSSDYINYVLNHQSEEACPIKDIRGIITGVYPNRNKYIRVINSSKKEFFDQRERVRGSLNQRERVRG